MKYIFLSAMFFFSSCAIQGEIFRLQERMRGWNQLLPQEQRSLFAKNDTNTVGAYLDENEKDPIFAEKLRNLRINEAIMAFDGVQTAHFFYNTLLGDLAKFSYIEFIDNITADDFEIFLSSTDGSSLADSKKLVHVFANARNNYGMTDFTEADILYYYRAQGVPSHLYIVVYDALAYAAKNGTLLDVLNKKYQSTSDIIAAAAKNVKSRRPYTKRAAENSLAEWNYVLSIAVVPSMSNERFLKIIVEYILPEMDKDVRTRTLDNLFKRFNISSLEGK